jgi:hypothetical protein
MQSVAVMVACGDMNVNTLMFGLYSLGAADEQPAEDKGAGRAWSGGDCAHPLHHEGAGA